MTTFFQILKKYPGREDIVVRLTYALGNLAADDDSARIQVSEIHSHTDRFISRNPTPRKLKFSGYIPNMFSMCNNFAEI
jgi:hypothetical protein